MECKITKIDELNIFTIQILGDIDLYNAPEFKSEIHSIFSQNQPDAVYLDISQVGYLDSSGCAVLVNTFSTIKNTGAEFYLSDNIQHIVRRQLQKTGIYELFQRIPSENMPLVQP